LAGESIGRKRKEKKRKEKKVMGHAE